MGFKRQKNTEFSERSRLGKLLVDVVKRISIYHKGKVKAKFSSDGAFKKCGNLMKLGANNLLLSVDAIAIVGSPPLAGLRSWS